LDGPRLRYFNVGRQRIASSLARRLIDLILSRDLNPGELIGHETELANQLGCSRAVLRETLRILEHEGAVIVKPGARGGIYCALPDVTPLATSLQLYSAFHGVGPVALADARTELEASMARLAAQRGSADELMRVVMARDAWCEACQAGDFSAAGAANMTLHRAIAQASHSPALQVLSEVTEAILFRQSYWPVGTDLPKILDIHDDVVDAMVDRDAGAAAAAMRIHLRQFRHRALEMEQEGWITRTKIESNGGWDTDDPTEGRWEAGGDTS
jgi:GntR family transcriptional repressor for pyruvate dehydrogenase complex